MAVFLYKAVARDGKMVEDSRDAADENALVAALQSEGFIPIQVVPASSRPFSRLNFRRSSQAKVSQKDLGEFTKQLATLLNAGLPLDRSLALLVELVPEESSLRPIVIKVLDKVRGGSPLSEALESQQGVFSRFYLNMIRAGEAGGGLEGVLERLSEYLERSRELRGTVTTALVYPIILVSMSVLSLFVLLTFVVPQFQEMFASAGKELPVPTQIVVAISEFLQAYWWVILFALAGFFLYMRRQFAEPGRRYVWDRRMLRTPMLGDLITKLEVGSFSRTLGTLLGNGVSLLAALSIVKETLNNRILAEAVEKAAGSLKEGGEMTTPMIESGLFPKMAMQMIQLGEETGSLQEMLNRVAVTYDREIRVTIERLLTLLEPVLIVGLGLLIAGIIISILMAILSVNDLAF
ncbi:MAG: type II secretion system F family protein [Methylococcaceae bacterium]|nr:type II secretion system F family protein [Methylococcaceae bacterium]MCI0734557.1 type II secretion system F family protein [Methylococcaceae bacterium]